MIHFPFLNNAVVCQYPLAKVKTFRTIANQMADGSQVKLSVAGSGRVSWELHLGGLSQEEWDSIESFYLGREGSLNTFVFLDPCDNLLCFSEEFGAEVWIKGPGLGLTSGAAGPFEGTTATTIHNQGAAAARLAQILNVPGDGTYCFSVYARGAQNEQIALVRHSDSGDQTRTFPLDDSWNRFTLPGSPGDEAEQVTFGIELEPGATVDVFGAQVECQLGESTYKKTHDKSGIYPNARFEQDSLAVSVDDPDQSSVTVRITARR
jgi:hypothetical protein